jgi:hypothetical protein
VGICPISKGKYPSQDIDCNRCNCGKKVMPCGEKRVVEKGKEKVAE